MDPAPAFGLESVSGAETPCPLANGGAPVLVGDVARVELVPDERRALPDLDGPGDVVAGIAVARYGENALAVIHGLKEKLAEVARGLPEGVSIQAVYDRSELIHRAIKTLRTTLIEESLIVALVCLVFLFHARSALVAIVMLPVPFALVGGVWPLWMLDYNVSMAVAVGFIALAGIAAETVVAIMAGLLPIMWSTGAGSEVMRRIAAPMVGGMVSSTVPTLLVIPALYALVKQHALARKAPAPKPLGLPTS